MGTAALLNSAATSAAVFFSSGRGSAAVFSVNSEKRQRRWSSDQRSSASVKIIDLPLPQKKNFDFEDCVSCSNLIIKSQLKSKLVLLEINTMKLTNENVKRSVRSQAMFH